MGTPAWGDGTEAHARGNRVYILCTFCSRIPITIAVSKHHTIKITYMR